ncbi:MAG: ATP-binding protein [Ferruginibacter sp.]
MRNKQLLLLLIFLHLISGMVKAQISDTLYNALPQELRPASKASMTHEERTELIYRVDAAVFLHNEKEMQEILMLCKYIIDTIKTRKGLKLKYTKAVGDFYMGTGENDSCTSYYQKVIAYVANDSGYYSYLAQGYMQLAGICLDENRPDSALQLLQKAQDYGDSKDSVFMPVLYSYYQMLYTKLLLREQALEYAKKSIAFMPYKEKWDYNYTNFTLSVASIYSHLYRETKQQAYKDSGTSYVRLVMKNQTSIWYSECYKYLGDFKFYDSLYAEAIPFYDSCLMPIHIDNTIMYPSLKNDCKLNRAICLIKTGHPEAIKIIESLEFTPRNFLALRRKSKALYEYAQATGNWKKAFEEYNKSVAYSDSLDLIKTRGRVFEANQKYSVAQKEIEIKSLENTNLKEKESKTKITVISILAVAALLLLVMSLYSANKRQQAKRLTERQRASELRQKELKEERERISQELHDDLGTGLTSIRLLTKRMITQQLPGAPVEIPNNIYKISGELVDQMGEIIWLMNHMDDTMFGLLSHLRIYMADSLQRMGIDMKLNFDNRISTDYNITGAQRRNILLTVKEIFNNAVKHSGAGLFSVVCSNTGNNVTITVSDNGKGIPAEISSRGNGLKNIRKRVKAMNGTVQFESVNGTQITIEIPAMQN